MAEREHFLSREQVKTLVEENDTLRERVRQLEAMLVIDVPLPRRWRLAPAEGTLLRALRAAAPGTLVRWRAERALYGDRDDVPVSNALNVTLVRLRRKLAKAASGIEVDTIERHGWRLSAKSCARFDRAVAAEVASYPASKPVPLSKVA